MADAKQGKAPEDFYNGSSQSRVVLAKPRLGGFGSSSFASSSNKTSNPFGSVLRPSQLKPAVNPFFKATDSLDEDDTKKEESDENRLKETEKAEVPIFVPLGSNSNARTGSQGLAPAQSSTSSASFVFGQNLSARVVMENVNNGEANNGEAKSDHGSTNGTELLFTSAAASVKENNQEEGSSAPAATTGNSGPGLAAAAAEYERSHARPPPPAASYNLTGEEGEINVLQISCRLFAWESGSWRERGRGVLRLNECAGGAGGARLVARVAGSLRVVLNTKLWPDMVADRAGTKSLRITAADVHNTVKLFLIMGAPADIAHLHRALTARIAVSKRAAPTSSCSVSASSQQAAERLEAAAGDDYLDKPDSDADHKHDQNERLDPGPKHDTEEYESNVDGMKEDHEANSLKRKEPAGDDTLPKRQCPDEKE